MNNNGLISKTVLLTMFAAALSMLPATSSQAGWTNCRLDWDGDGDIDQGDYLVGDPVGGFYAEWYIHQYYPSYYPVLFPGADSSRLDYNGDGVIDQNDLMGPLEAAQPSEGYYVEWYIYMFYPGYYPIFMPEYDCNNPTPDGLPCDPAMIDPLTGLCWHPIMDTDSEQIQVDWTAADAECENLVANDYDDWRLPTIDEHRANINPICENIYTSGSCGIHDDCSLYPPFEETCDTTCVEYETCYFPYRNDECGPCNWAPPIQLWSISLGTENYYGQYWSGTEGIKSGASDEHWGIGYTNGFLSLHQYGKAVACVREEQPLDSAGLYQDPPPAADKGCAGTQPICSYLKGADFGVGTESLGFYYDGKECLEAIGNSQTNEYCLFATDVDCAKSCAQAGECNPRVLTGTMNANYWGGPSGYDPENHEIYVDADNNPDIGGMSICVLEGRVNDFYPIYQDPWIDYSQTQRCTTGYTERRLANAVPETPELWDYLDMDEFEWVKACTYSILPWISRLDGYPV